MSGSSSEEALRAASASVETGATGALPELSSFDVLNLEDRRQDIDLKRTYAIWILVLLAAQMLIVNVVIILYAALGVDWRIPNTVLHLWIGSTVVQVLGIIAIVTRYLFPPRP